MKKTIALLALLTACQSLMAQNVGIGTNEPMNKLQVQGSLLITAPSIATNTAPTATQTYTMLNNIANTYGTADSTARIYDPGGPSGNYLPNLISYVNFSASVNIAFCRCITALAYALTGF